MKKFIFFLAVLIIPIMIISKTESASLDGTAPAYRFWSGYTHFYTQSEEEKNILTTDENFKDIWSFEEAAFDAGYYDNDTEECEIGTPVYRFWSEPMQTHFYAESLEIKEYVEETWPDAWQYEKIAFCAELEENPGTIPVYRFWSESLGRHFYTVSEEDMQAIKDNWSDVWSFESIVFYAYKFENIEATNYVIYANAPLIEYLYDISDIYNKYHQEVTDTFKMIQVADESIMMNLLDELVNRTDELALLMYDYNDQGDSYKKSYNLALWHYANEVSEIIDSDLRYAVKTFYKAIDSEVSFDEFDQALSSAWRLFTEEAGVFNENIKEFRYESNLSESAVKKSILDTVEIILEDESNDSMLIYLEPLFNNSNTSI